MARTRVSYAEAVRLLAGKADVGAVLGRLGAGALLVDAQAAPGVLSLVDTAGEANALLRDLVGAAPATIRASRGKRHFELLEATHGVLIVSSFFDTVAEKYGSRSVGFRLTGEERRAIGTKGMHPLRDELSRPSAPMPGAVQGFADNLPAVENALQRMAQAFYEFVADLGARLDLRVSTLALAVGASARYQERYVRLGADVPEFAIWTQPGDHAAIRTEASRQTDTLVRLADLLAATVAAVTPAAEAEALIARHAAAVLRRPLWHAEGADGLAFPTVEQGFVSPGFRRAMVDKESRLADEAWWAMLPAHDDLASFLAAYFADPASTQRPLVILGHPGAGKSLLTEVLAARLPTEVFTTVRVPLRAVDPDAQIHQQVEATVERLVKERVSWGELCRAADTTKVVLLDGFDELVQATGVVQSHYVDLAGSFQQEEWINGRPTIVVITSRTLVMDRTVVREGTVVIKLEPFDEDQVGRWIGAWNEANAGRSGVRPLTTAELWRHQDLASQPLLLLMLAIYATQDGTSGLDNEDLSTEELYRRLLDEFIRRQIRDKARSDLGPAVFAAQEADGRRDLAAVAFAMFNRGHQFVSEDDLERDLEALHPGNAPAGTAPGEPLTRSRRTIAGFFFVHVAQTDDEARAPGRRTYEFLHATFAEYLVAEQTTELLRDLAEDWRRSRRRSYGASLDERVLRALLSHQPLTNGDQVVAFLASMIQRLAPETRGELREALLDLFRGARTRISDDTYRPTPLDVVGRVAAYTANLTLLAVLCDPEGLPAAALSEPPDAPSLESTVGLWRAGLDAEAQIAFFSRLQRSGERFILGTGIMGPAGVPAAEARLAGDHYAEAVELAGSRTLVHGGPVTGHGRDFHLQVLDLMGARWPGAPAGRMMPFDERLYVQLADLAESSDAPLLLDSLRMLVKLLIEDHRHLSPELVDRLLAKAILPRAESLQPVLSVLALRSPDLLTRHPQLRQAFPMGNSAPFLHEVARSVRDGHPEAIDPIVATLRANISALDPRMLSSYDVAPSMVSGLAFAPSLLPTLIEALSEYRELAWPQISPQDMLAAVEAIGDRIAAVDVLLREYVEFRAGDDLDEESRAALERITTRLDETQKTRDL